MWEGYYYTFMNRPNIAYIVQSESQFNALSKIILYESCMRSCYIYINSGPNLDFKVSKRVNRAYCLL